MPTKPFQSNRILRLKPKLKKALQKVKDPELDVNVVDLGLIYRVEETEQEIKIQMTLTTPFCPFGAFLVERVKEEVQKVAAKKSVTVEMVWEPVWSIERIKPEVRKQLGL